MAKKRKGAKKGKKGVGKSKVERSRVSQLTQISAFSQ
jgi:hypothetical protein